MINYDREHYRPPEAALTVTVSSPYVRLSEQMRAKLDSGADMSVLPMRSMKKLNLVPVQVIKARGYDARLKSVPTYLANVSFFNFAFEMIEVLGAERGDVLLGRDVLNQITATLRGKELKFDLSDPT